MIRALLLVGVGAAALAYASRGGSLATVPNDRSVDDEAGAGWDLGAGVLELAGLAVDAVDETVSAATGYAPLSAARWERDAEKLENAPFVVALHDAEARQGIPYGLLVRLAWQESRFNPNAINASGASGIMQIVPRWHPEVNPWDPFAAIAYGAGYLARLFRLFGSWELALKAYNWGEGNVALWLKGQAVQPAETEKYSRQILADVRATGQVIA